MRLQAFAEKREDDSVQRLEDTLDDKERLAVRFKEQFLTTKRTLESTQKELKQTQEVVMHTQLEVREGLVREEELKDKIMVLNVTVINLKRQLENTQKDLKQAQQVVKHTQLEVREGLVREQELKDKIAELNEAVGNLEKQIQEERRTAERAMAEKERYFQDTAGSLIEKHQEEIETLEKKMSNVLEEEGQAFKKSLATATQKMMSTEEKCNKTLAEMRTQSNDTLQKLRNEEKARIEEMVKNHTAEVEQLNKSGKDQQVMLVAKGKAVLKEEQKNSKKLMEEAQADWEKKLLEASQTNQRFRQQQEEYERRARAKISAYKTKLHAANGKEKQLSAEAKEMQERHVKLERGFKKLRDENDRFRRQLGSRFGGENDIQKEFTKLQKEFNLILEENRKLKDKQELRENEEYSFHGDTYTANGIGGDLKSSFSGNGSGGNVSSATIAHLRSEYEDTIQNLQDEKRELVMRNSAAISDVQKTEQRFWELEEDCGKLRNQVTTLTLEIQRAEMRGGSISVAGEAKAQRTPRRRGVAGGGRPSIDSTDMGLSVASRFSDSLGRGVDVCDTTPSRHYTSRRTPGRSWSSRKTPGEPFGRFSIEARTDDNTAGGTDMNGKENKTQNLSLGTSPLELSGNSGAPPTTPLTPSSRSVSNIDGSEQSVGTNLTKRLITEQQKPNPTVVPRPSLMDYTKVKDKPLDDGKQECTQS